MRTSDSRCSSDRLKEDVTELTKTSSTAGGDYLKDGAKGGVRNVAG